jgi:hypothetical protein
MGPHEVNLLFTDLKISLVIWLSFSVFFGKLWFDVSRHGR